MRCSSSTARCPPRSSTPPPWCPAAGPTGTTPASPRPTSSVSRPTSSMLAATCSRSWCGRWGPMAPATRSSSATAATAPAWNSACRCWRRSGRRRCPTWSCSPRWTARTASGPICRPGSRAPCTARRWRSRCSRRSGGWPSHWACRTPGCARPSRWPTSPTRWCSASAARWSCSSSMPSRSPTHCWPTARACCGAPRSCANPSGSRPLRWWLRWSASSAWPARRRARSAWVVNWPAASPGTSVARPPSVCCRVWCMPTTSAR